MVHVRPATTDDIAAAADLFARAFEHDPVWVALMPRTRHRARTIRWIMHADLAGPGPRPLDVAVDENGRVVGALRWSAPRIEQGPTPWWRRQAARIGWALGNLLGGSLGRGLQQERAVRAHRPREPHWYLQDVAADPERQGQGIGSALLRYRLAQIDQAGAPAALEATTTGSARLYARHGFVTVATVNLLPGAQSQVMLRPAADRAENAQLSATAEAVGDGPA
ncbi:GNAT family N-acetyltransferase [Kineosporia babensis]|uniref:GNAT family N-acetyltransferase n=1 Tax=Kineosporia babensis TaxID=499548 RepID=A0A9X1SZF6_9ACTN|nr:GNAT family N-acetyltransferase [Kineosporia babensis]MCD5311983.1 GNAT family N-acetyltransferase [Kineosporia babensis]